VHLVGGHPGERDARTRRAGDHRGARGRPGGELHVVRNVRPLPPPVVLAPGSRQVEPEIDQGMRPGGDAGREHVVWKFSTCPVIPACWRAAPAAASPFFSSAVSSSTTIASPSPSRATMNRCSAVSADFQSRRYSASSACIRRGVACPAISPSCQHHLRPPCSASSAPMQANPVSRDLACKNTARAAPPAHPAASPASRGLLPWPRRPPADLVSSHSTITRWPSPVARRHAGHTSITQPSGNRPGL